jgi:hypothetical protein
MPAASARTRARLGVEPLEDRSVPAVLDGIGVVGDSYTRERGGNNWPEQLYTMRGLNFGPSHVVSGDGVSWPDFAYVVDGTPLTFLSDGTVAGLAAQVAAGNVTLVYLDGVGRDFALRYPAIYHGVLAGADLDAFVDDELARVRAAADALLAAGPVKLVFENVGDFGATPFVRENPRWGNFLGLPAGEPPDPLKMGRFTDAIRAANGRVAALADDYRAPLVDQFGFVSRITDPARPLVVGGYPVDTTPTADSPSTVRVVDPLDLFVDAQHVGPVAQGLKANVVLDAVRLAYGADVPPLSDQEILAYAYGRAGLTPPPPGTTPTYYDVTGLVHYRRATPTVTVVGGSYVFDGQPHPATATVTGLGGVDLGTPALTYSYTDDAGAVVTTADPPVEPGYYTVTAYFPGTTEYEPATGTAFITIAYEARTLTDLSRAFRAGRAIPIKLMLVDAAGNNVSSAGVSVAAVRLERVEADGTRTEVAPEDTGDANPDNLFRYDADLGGYIFNLSTRGLGAGEYEFTWTADGDPTEHHLGFRLV